MARVRRLDRGATAVEFSLLTIPFMLLVLGIIQYGFYFWTAETANSAAREGARRVVVGDCWNDADLETFVAGHAPRATGAQATVGGAPIAGVSGLQTGDMVVVTVTADAETLGFWPLPGGGTVSRTYDAHLEVRTQSAPADDAC